MGNVAERLQAMGLVLHRPVAPIANYVPTRRAGALLFVSGQVCIAPDGTLPPEFQGKLGAEVTLETGQRAARQCAINVLAQVNMAMEGDLDRLRCLRLGGFINAVPDFAALAQVMNGASDLLVEMLGDAGRHTRSTIGVAELPIDAAVEVEALFEVL